MSCVFCDIVAGKIPCKKVAENKNALAFLDISPLANGHTVIISKKHYSDWQNTPANVLADMVKLSQEVADKLSKSKYKPWGFNYLSNQGSIAGQAVFHVHLHVIPKYFKNQGFKLSHDKIEVDDIDKIAKVLKLSDK